MNLGDLNAVDCAGFVDAIGPIFEHSPWIAERAWDRRPFANTDALMAAMLAVVDAASDDEKITLVRAHPDLAGKAARAGALTEHSTAEQAGAGLDRLSDEQFERFHRLNDAYTRDTILDAFDTRLENNQAAELNEALRNIGMIARFRLEDLLAG
jgi:2-oxo-4-hydroxy-4-carboxy-5-ureidoimidazoline decarboxylase